METHSEKENNGDNDEKLFSELAFEDSLDFEGDVDELPL